MVFTYSYVVLANFSPSAVRAFIMIMLAMLAQILKKHPNSINILIATFIFMTADNAYIVYDIGFILSVVCTFGITVLTPILKQKIDEKIAVNLSAYIFTMPIILYLSGYISIFSVLTNAFISYLVAFITIFSLITFTLFSIANYKFILYPVLFLGHIFIKLLYILKTINFNLYVPNFSIYMLIISYVIILIYFNLIKTTNKLKEKY
ncbi:ComEC/Rec2 family competence protein [Caloramator sp. mosi_1]|uniref:ComEC/Rec2 family competence protein n=1 Tax=Caloramator sp. mosi_1 TaxID=3023090 RepID=UPI002363100C|nr:ComEC/Rec2 family competence protein [Caloramator sp. mosi_1]WDC85842.1 ComEC/Rec2 family competence protein [Caloramator sp. mosi_1]